MNKLAGEKFDEKKGWRFSTYATFWIRHSIKRGLDNDAYVIGLPVHISAKIRRIETAERELAQELGCEPSREQVTQATGLPLEEVLDLEKVRSKSMPSIDKGKEGEDNEGTAIANVIAGDESIESQIDSKTESEELVGTYLSKSKLTEREILVLSLRYPMRLEGFELKDYDADAILLSLLEASKDGVITYQSIGEALGIDESNAKKEAMKIEASALKKIAAHHPKPKKLKRPTGPSPH